MVHAGTLEIHDLSKGYAVKGEILPALDNISLSNCARRICKHRRQQADAANRRCLKS